MTRNNRRWSAPDAALVLCVLALAALFILESDDCYFFYWRYDSLRDFLLTWPDTAHAKIVSVPQNGRYLGNLLGVILAKAFESPLFPLRVLYFGGGLLLLARGGALALGAERPRERTFFLLSLLLLAHRGVWQEVYGWGAAYVNYLTPLAGMVFLPALIRGAGGPRRGLRRLGIFLLAFACCLFMEPDTLFLLAAALPALGWSLWRDRRLLPGVLPLALGSLAGNLVMFSAPGYAAVGSDGLRQAGLALLGDNLATILTGALVQPFVPAACVTGLLLWHLRHQGCRYWPACALAALPIHLVCVVQGVRDLFSPGTLLPPPASPLLVCAGAALALLWLVMLALWRDGGVCRVRVLGLALALCLFSAPLLVVSIGGSRNFFSGYVVLCLTALALYDGARALGLRRQSWPRAAALLACCALLLLYSFNCLVYRQRLSLGRELARAGETQLTLPLLPFPGYARNEQEWKGDLSYQIYAQTPWDVSFTFIPYRQWAQQHDMGGDPLD